MAEETYTMFNNILLGAIARAKFNGTQHSILLIILRFTFGFHREYHELSAGFIAEALGLHPVQIRRELKKLIDMRVVEVVKETDNKNPREIKINTNINTWDIVTNPLPLDEPHKNELVTTLVTETLLHSHNQLVTTDVTNPLPKKETINKSLKKDINKQSESEYTDEFEKFWTIYPRTLGKKESFKVYQKVIKQGGQAEEINLAANNYALYCKQMNTEERYIKHPKTFLNEERYKDFLEERVITNGKQTGNKSASQFAFLNENNYKGEGIHGTEVEFNLGGLF